MTRGRSSHQILSTWLAASLVLLTAGTVSILYDLATHAGSIAYARASSPTIEISLYPNVVELQLAPGETGERVFRIWYPSGPPTEARLDLFEFFNDAAGKTHYAPPGELFPDAVTQPVDFGRWASAAWITPLPGLIPLRAGEERTVAVKVTVPADAEPGEYRAFGLVSFANLFDASSVGIQPRLGIRIYTTVPGPAVRRVEAVQLSTDHTGWLPWNGPVELGVTLRNAGTVHVRSRGHVTVTPCLAGAPTTLPLLDRRVLPDETASFSLTWAGPPSWALFDCYRARFEFEDETVAAAAPLDQPTIWVVSWNGFLGIGGLTVAMLITRPRRQLQSSLPILVRKLEAALKAALAAFRSS
ncbi:MAG: hypothetical protein HY329_07435 [Chloroflexi bacterium]|nr:hypothetical protein [Chloroflexota bacterium]